MPPLPVHSRPPSQVTLARRLVTFIAGKRSKWLVLAMWLAVLSGAGPLSGKLQGITKNDATSYLPAGAESTKVIAELSRSGSNQSQSTVDVLYVRSGGLTEADQSRVRADRQRLAQLFPTQPAATLIPSRDGAAALLSQTLPPDNGNSTTLHNTISELRTMARVNDPAGLAIDVTGQAAILSDFVDGFGKVDLTVLLAALAVVTILLLLIYRSPFLWLLPLLVAASGYTLAAAAVYLLGSRTGLVINSESAGILSVLVLGAGTDYALLLIARYREELRRHVDRHVAMQEALLRAGPAILASAATVTIGLLCLVVAELNSDRGLGPVAAVGIVSVFVAMTTLLPVLLVVMSRWVFWPFSPRYGSRSADEHSVWTRLAAGIARRPRRTWLATSAGLVLLGIGLTQLHQGLRTGDALRPAPDSVLGERQLAAHYPAGYASTTLIVLRATAIQPVADAARSMMGVSTVLPVTDLGGRALMPVVLSDPPDSPAAETTVERLRQAVHAVPNADALVGGDTAVAIDTRAGAIHDERLVIPLVLAVVFVILIVLLRALVAPVLLITTVVLSYLAALGASAALFTGIFKFPATDFSVPLLGFVFLVALGVDYNIFLITRVREEVSMHGHRPGVRRGLSATGGVITSAGIILAATFSVLTVLPLVSLAQLGLLVALGVLLDTFVVRSILVPALIIDVGEGSWWPGHLGRFTAEPVIRRNVSQSGS